MPRVVPTQISSYLNAQFPDKNAFGDVVGRVGAVAGFLELYDNLPGDLIVLPAEEYARLVANVGTIRLSLDQYRNGKTYDCLSPIGGALLQVRDLIRKLAVEFPSTKHDLSFVTDVDLQRMIALDISAVAADLQSGEWKGATVLAASCCEALLLYGLQAKDNKDPGSLKAAVAAVKWPTKRPNDADPTDRTWDLFSYTAVAHRLKLISDNTKSALDPARDFRNLIHPAKSVRQKAACDRGTAYVSAGAMENVITDLRKYL
jgi:hypothetical protein